MEHFRVEPMKVDLISITPPEELVKVWVNSRPDLLEIVEDGEGVKRVHDRASEKLISIKDYADMLIKMNLSNVYFANVTCNVHSSLITREFFYHFNNYIAQWAKTNRNGIDAENLIASEEAYTSADDPYYESMYKLLKEFNSGIGDMNFDNVKENLPLSFQTTWQFSMPVKLLMRIIGYAYHQFGRCTFTNSIWLAFSEVEELKPYMGLVGKYIDYDDPLFPYESAREDSDDGHTVTIKENIGLTVFSHVIRHEGVQIGGFVKFLRKWLKDKTISRKGSGLTFECSLTLPKKRWIEIIKLRTSWFAMTDNWRSPNTWGVYLKRYITGDLEKDKPYLKYFTEDGKLSKKDIESYASETSIRVRKGNTTQLPDAFLLQSRDIVEQRIKNVGLNPLLADYLQMFDLGYVEDNPNNETRLKWESYVEH